MSYIIVGRDPVTLLLFVVKEKDFRHSDAFKTSMMIREFSTKEEAEEVVKTLVPFRSRWYDVVEVDKD